MKKIILLLVLAAAGGYWLILSKPALYYKDALEYKNFTLRGRGTLPAEPAPALALDRALEKLLASELYSPDAKFDIYLAGSPGQLRFFAPFAPGNYARVSPVSGGIFLASADFAEDRARTAPEAVEYRALSKVITSAAVRELARRQMKPLAYLSVKDWKFTGYGDRISGGAGDFTVADTCAQASEEGSALREYEYGLAVDLFMQEEKGTFRDLLNRNYSYEGAERQLKKRHCGK
ncbi:MAG: hypothetical protein A2X35_12275 [Elusimicrobia bacterium GWA2_61_42]|nr:MAG: hypothetical protein A2X35_12275 [Elusimicrobia bacterium GWA2_61_42]OGR80510.1 MAG: hypothetical protein A2X38_02900 [Elusimicrobia bacterium GWC2_61_25]